MNESIFLGEVLYYYQCRIKGLLSTLAVVSVYSAPLPDLTARSCGTFTLCKYFGDENLIVIDVVCIKAVVAMIPHTPPTGIVDIINSEDQYCYLVERPGLDAICLLGGDHEILVEP